MADRRQFDQSSYAVSAVAEGDSLDYDKGPDSSGSPRYNVQRGQRRQARMHINTENG